MIRILFTRLWRTNSDGLIFWPCFVLAFAFLSGGLIQATRLNDPILFISSFIGFLTIFLPGTLISHLLMKRRIKQRRLLRETYQIYREHIDQVREDLGVKHIFEGRY